MSGLPDPAARSWAARDDQVIAWTVAAHRTQDSAQAPDAPPLLSTGDDLRSIVALAAEQPARHRDHVRGVPEHLITTLSVWPSGTYPDQALLLMQVDPADGGMFLAAPVLVTGPTSPVAAYPDAAIKATLTTVFGLAQRLLDKHEDRRLSPGLTDNIPAWRDRYLDERAAHYEAVDPGDEPASLIDVEIDGCELLLEVPLREPAA